MLHYLKRSEIDLNRWDTCVRNSPQQMIYAYAGYLDISTKNQWDAVVEIQEGKYVSVFPLPFKKQFGVPFIYQPFHSQQLGLFVTSQSQVTKVAEYLKTIPARFRKVYLQLNTENTFLVGALPADFSSVPRINYHLDLEKPYATLNESYTTNQKRNLKKARKENYKVTTTANLADLIQLYRRTKGKELKAVKDRHYKLFEEQYAFLLQNSLAQIYEIRENETLIAGALFLTQPGKLIFLFSATSPAGKKHGAMTLLIDQVIKLHADTATILDFEGGTILNLARFYSSFGAKPVTYLSVSRNNLPWYLKWLIK